MSEMVERVARAIWEAEPVEHCGRVFEDLFDFEKTDYYQMARAAIAAMREPTKPMVEVITEGTTQYDIMPPPAEIWGTMIDEALK